MSSTIVTATVLDPNGNPYQFGTGSISVYQSGNQQPYSGTFPIPRTIVIDGLDGFGSFTQKVFDNSSLTPAGTQWIFRICDRTGIYCFSTPPITITGTSVDLSTYISTYSVLLPGSGGGLPCTSTPFSLQYNNNGVFDCIPDLTWSAPHTLLAGAALILDFSAATALRIPTSESSDPQILFNSGGVLSGNPNLVTNFQAYGMFTSQGSPYSAFSTFAKFAPLPVYPIPEFPTSTLIAAHNPDQNDAGGATALTVVAESATPVDAMIVSSVVHHGPGAASGIRVQVVSDDDTADGLDLYGIGVEVDYFGTNVSAIESAHGMGSGSYIHSGVVTDATGGLFTAENIGGTVVKGVVGIGITQPVSGTGGIFTNSHAAVFGGTTNIGIYIGAVASTDTSSGNSIPAAENYSLYAAGTAQSYLNGPLTLGNLLTKYNGIATVSNGIPAEYATIDLTGQTDSIGGTPIYVVPTDGQYRLSWNAKITTAGGVSSTIGPLSVFYTDPDGITQNVTCLAQVSGGSLDKSDVGNSSDTFLLGIPMLLNCAASGTVSFNFAYASNPANDMAYNLHMTLERL